MICHDDLHDPGRIYDMWQRNFRDPVPYADFYFSQVYGRNEVLLSLDDASHDLMGMIHLNPYTLCMGGKDLPAHYIVGVATDEEYRRQGVMRRLLHESFDWLRQEGECLTYLMPADQDYYLPFDFRFGRPQEEMEFYLSDKPEEGDWRQRTQLTDEDLMACACLENDWKAGHYDLFTRIDPAYLLRLQKESIADFGRMFYIFCGDEYKGRFCATAEYDCLILSRIFCGPDRADFLQHMIALVQEEFHYSNYQIILDCSWKEDIPAMQEIRGLRHLPVREKTKIMFRILDLEGLSSYLSSAEDASFTIYVRDDFLPDNGGLYQVSCLEGRADFKKISDLPSDRQTGSGETDQGMAMTGTDAGAARISIADLTSWIFGAMDPEELERLDGLNGSDDAVLKGLKAVRPVEISCIMEIV